ncbi:FRG domain-containing protein [uncultured Clostridium sp.]|uniref:FRG domain-containing protein n=1 Tax=uncultured Clostridium sp. TaxID=59620 RepID=UPI0025DB0EC4|nr:FRG domain-containing protein [uncultured Clostridium sp.]
MGYNERFVSEVNSFEEYIHFIKEYKEKNNCELWYRGHASNAWELKPNLYRNAKMDVGDGKEITRLRYNIVNFNNEFKKFKQKVLNEGLSDTLELNDFHLMFIAQHYGMLTPILDWTIDPLVALFFAVEEANKFNDNFPVIYILKPNLLNESSMVCKSDKSSIKEPICIDDISNESFYRLTKDLNNTPANHIPIAIFSEMDFSHRISRQSGRFTLHGAIGPLNYSWNDITIKGQQFTDKIKINAGAVEEMKEYLSSLSINKNTVYRKLNTPLDKICNRIKQEELKKFERE